jgi:serine/threonine-protein kinase
MLVPMTLIDRLAGYEVLEVLGYGASSTIYAVQEPKSGQVYAIKRVVRRTPSDQRFLEQAITEHEVACRFDHPVLRKSHKLMRRRKMLRTAEVLVLMEMIDGVTLEQRRPKHLNDLVDVFVHVTEGLEAMHKGATVHCDIKPNNILLNSDREVKVIDFGQSCPVGTVKQRIQGTPDYIAPEQVLRRRITIQTDVFNFGATLYWCLTNHHVPTLIPAGNREVGVKPDNRFRPARELNPNIPAALDALVTACLRTEPKDRPASMKEVRERLQLVFRQKNGAQIR